MVIKFSLQNFVSNITVLQMTTAFLYNLTNSYGIVLFLNEITWHKINNVVSTTYLCLLLIHLIGLENKDTNTILSYLAFTLVWIAQLKDEYWMDNSMYTVFVVIIFAALPFIKHISVFLKKRELPPFNFKSLLLGSISGFIASIFFLLGLNSDKDWLRHWHGLSHLFFGGCLYFLWGVLSLTKSSKNTLPFI